MRLPNIRLWSFALTFLFMVGALIMGYPETSIALDSLPRTPRVGSSQIPLGSYERIPIEKVLSNPSRYYLREIRVAGIVRNVQTQIMTRGCGKPYELSVISLEDESGVVDVLDQGACGRNTSTVRAPMLATGNRVDLLVQIVSGTDGLGGPPEVFALWIEYVKD